MIIDARIHCSGNEKPDDVLRALDEAGVEKAVSLAPFLGGASLLVHLPPRDSKSGYLVYARLGGRRLIEWFRSILSGQATRIPSASSGNGCFLREPCACE